MPDTVPAYCCTPTAKWTPWAAAERCSALCPIWIYADYSVQLRPGDKLILSTDGVIEAEDPQLEEFGEQRMISAARSHDSTALDTQRAIMQSVSAFCGGNFRDDATLVVLRLL